ncbi:hypothetical protein AABM38_09580 [Heyndrickxia sp. MSNUG]|uniref:hypothetical protein n=1 Tax=Heyndrickxia sp. MSNUG TaxID=3136677 RepID=UPI003C2B8E53
MARLTFNSESTSKILFVSAIIMLISSLFMPFVLVFIIQDYLYLSSEKWFYDTPATAYVLFIIGMLWIPIMMLIHLFIQWKFELRCYKWITILLMTLSIPFFMFGISNYYYLDDKGIHFNDVKTFNTITSYEWADFKNAKEVYTKSNNVTVMDHYEFETKKGEIIDLPSNHKVSSYKLRILEKLEEHGIEITNNLADLYE